MHSQNDPCIGLDNGLISLQLSEPMLACCSLDPWEQISVEFLSKKKRRQFENASCKRVFCPHLNVLSTELFLGLINIGWGYNTHKSDMIEMHVL